MLLRNVYRCLPVVACSLVLALGGCVAVPLAQMAVSQLASSQAACVAGAGCQTGTTAGSFAGLSKGFTDSYHNLTSLVSDNQTAAPPAPAK